MISSTHDDWPLNFVAHVRSLLLSAVTPPHGFPD